VIFVTVGTQLAFDRLVKAVDLWIGNNPGEKAFAQVGPAEYRPLNCESKDFVRPDKADALFREADLIVSHAGMGSILTALKYKKPILIMPRKAALGEHRNDHQLATAKWLGNKPGVTVAWEAEDVARLLDARFGLQGGDGISEFASPELIANLKKFIHS
jgi:UDP-N-acetylglucosamine transferase subunit ALG13